MANRRFRLDSLRSLFMRVIGRRRRREIRSDWEVLAESEPWAVPRGNVSVLDRTSDLGAWAPRSREFSRLFPVLTRLLSRSRITPLTISGYPWTLFSWGDPAGELSGWLSPAPSESPLENAFVHHRVLLQSFGGVTERFNDAESTWLLSHIDALTMESAQSDASFIADYDWIFEQHGVPIPIDLEAYYCIAREANGNSTLCHRKTGEVLLFASDHDFDHIEPLEGCPEYSLYRIREVKTFTDWVEKIATQWVEVVEAQHP